MPLMTLLTVPWFLGEVRGYSKLYDTIDIYGWGYFILSVGLFLMFTDFFIYCIHRGLHHRSVYSWIHKTHHKFIVPTPFASHAFHYLDGYLQSMPYHWFVFLIPM